MLTVKNLYITLNEGASSKKVVENISFTLKPGESLGIVGESGSGKTITALSILQLLPPVMKISRGQILLERPGNKAGPSGNHEPGTTTDSTIGLEGTGDQGSAGELAGTGDQGSAGVLAETGGQGSAGDTSGCTDLAMLNEKQMQAFRGRVISMIFQEPMSSLNPSMRCGDQISEAVRLHLRLSARDTKVRTLSLLDEVHLPAEPGFYRKYPHQLSGGQRQRVMIAMALAGKPDILIADEPTTALDVTVQKKILQLLTEIRQNRQMSMLFISHDLGVIRSVCENTLVMYKGKIVESGKVAELFRRPKHPYTRGLIACRPLPGDKPHRLPTLADFMDQEELLSPADKGTNFRAGKAGLESEPPESKQDLAVSQSEPLELQGKPLESQGKPPESLESTPALLEIRNLQVVYTLKRNFFGKAVRSLRAVDGISFSIDPGETLGLIGESGCGKSTLGRSLIRLIQSRKGEILFQGTPVSSLKGKELNEFRRKVQFIFQDPYSSLNPRIAVGPSIMEVMRVHGIRSGRNERKSAALELLGRVGLSPEHFNRYPHEFSGGQRQRIGLARALATGPELIICDESVSSLDVSVQARILNLLNDLKDSLGLTYLFISHDLSVVRYMSGRILVMKDGKLLEQGTGEEVFSNPSSAYTKELIDSILH